MAVMVLDPHVAEQVLAERAGCDGKQYDEVWDGIYVLVPLPDNDHQRLVSEFNWVLAEAMESSAPAKVYPGVNLSDRNEGWEKNYREPDVAVFLSNTQAINRGTHWQGAADFLVEIASPGEHTHWKIPFYSRLGVVELLVIDREPWSLELYRQQDGRLLKVGCSTPGAPEMLESRTVGLTFQLVPGEPRPQIQVKHPASGREWTI